MLDTKFYQSLLCSIKNNQIYYAAKKNLPQIIWSEKLIEYAERDFETFCVLWAEHVVAMSDKMTDDKFFKSLYFYTEAYSHAQTELISYEDREEMGFYIKINDGYMNEVKRQSHMRMLFYNDNKLAIDPVWELLVLMRVRDAYERLGKPRFFGENEEDDFVLWENKWKDLLTERYFDSYEKDWSKKLI